MLTTTLIFAFAHGWLFKSMGGETKDFIGGVIIGLVPGYVFSVIVVPICGLIIVASRTPRFFLHYICLPALIIAALAAVYAGF